MEKRGDFREGESRSDFDMTKKATHVDADGFGVADKANADMLYRPVPIQKTPEQQRNKDK